MSLDDPSNRVYIQGHRGPHPEAYHSQVFEMLQESTDGCGSQFDCRRKLVHALDKLAGRICTPDSALHKLLTKTS
jgi:hypothetical protein